VLVTSWEGREQAPSMTGTIRRPAPASARPGRRRIRRPTFAIPAAVALLALVAALIVAIAVSGDPPPAARGTLVAHGSSGVHGSVDLFDPSSSNGRVVVHLKGLAVAPAGDHYTIWVLREGAREMTPVASIVSGEDARIDLPLPGPGRYTELDVSLQRNDASAVHSSTNVATAALG
jgi:hypothetical protein